MKPQVDKKIIGFDMDGIVLDHTKIKLFLAQKFNLDIKKEQTSSDIIKKLIPKDIYPRFQIYLNHDPRFMYMCSPMPGAKNILSRIKKAKIRYFLISRRSKPIQAVKILKHHGFWPEYFNKNNTFFVTTPEDKNIKAKELGVTHYFDDQYTVLDKLTDVKRRFLFDSINVFKNPPYKRIRSWKEIAKFI